MHETPDMPVRTDKCAEPDDPMEFTAAAFPGDTTDSMAECFVEEFMIQGFPDEAILRLFATPHFAGTHRVWRERGEGWVRELIARVRAGFGGVRFRTTVAGGAPSEEEAHA